MFESLYYHCYLSIYLFDKGNINIKTNDVVDDTVYRFDGLYVKDTIQFGCQSL